MVGVNCNLWTWKGSVRDQKPTIHHPNQVNLHNRPFYEKPSFTARQACFGLYRSSLSPCSFKECMFSIYIKVTCSFFLSFKPMHSKKKTPKRFKSGYNWILFKVVLFEPVFASISFEVTTSQLSSFIWSFSRCAVFHPSMFWKRKIEDCEGQNAEPEASQP